MARDKNLRPCLPLKPQEKSSKYILVKLTYKISLELLELLIYINDILE